MVVCGSGAKRSVCGCALSLVIWPNSVDEMNSQV